MSDESSKKPVPLTPAKGSDDPEGTSNVLVCAPTIADEADESLASSSYSFKNSGTSNGAPPPMISTPARDPAAIVAQRMQRLRLHSSTAMSPATVSAESPMRTPYTPNRPCDLTPVMKNTGTGFGGFDLGLDLKLGDDCTNLISPDSGEDGYLHGEHLAFPGSLCTEDTHSATAVPVPSGPRRLPPLSSRGLLPLAHRNNVPCTLSDDRPNRANSPPVARKFTIPDCPVLRAPELTFASPVDEPFSLPMSGKGYSFTSREQYEKEVQQDGFHHTLYESKSSGLKQYQPSRRDSDLTDIGEIPAEDLEGIFIARRGRDRKNERTPLSSPLTTTTTTPWTNHPNIAEESFATIPMDERQWSIPSIRMASHLKGGSVASCTTYEDDDESSLQFRDDASLSSRGSFTSLTCGDAPIVFSPSTDHHEQSSTMPITRLTSANDAFDDVFRKGCFKAEEKKNSSKQHHVRRQKRKEEREQAAFEWLRTVKAGKNEVDEAASSKFLTGRKNHDLYPTVSPQRPQKRLSAALV